MGLLRVVVALFALLLPRVVCADEPSREKARAVFERAEADDAAGAFAQALAEYDDAVAKDPSGAFVPKARARAAMLRSHAEGDFAPLARLERVRRDPMLASDATEIDTLAHDADGFPPGLVRAEARMLVAEAYAGRLRRERDAIPVLDKVLGDPSADPLIARLALRMLVTARLDTGDLDGAAADVRAHADKADPSIVADVRRRLRRRPAHAAALSVIAATVLFAALALIRAAQRGELGRVRGTLRASWKMVLTFAAFVGFGGALLATRFEAGTGAPFLALGAVLVPIVLLARAWAAIGAENAAARVLRGALSAAAVVAAGFLVLEWIDVHYLASFGL